MTSVVLLDVNETLFSLDAVGRAFSEVGLPSSTLPLWFARVLRDGFAASATGHPAGFPEIAGHHVRAIADEQVTAVPVDDDDVDRVIAAFDEVTAHDDVEEGLRHLHDEGVRLVPFTNGSAPVVARFLERSGLTEFVDAPRDVGAAGAWKPAPAAYDWACDELDVAPADVALLAVHPWDVAGAMRAGLRGAWLDRDGERWPSFLPRPDVTGRTLPAVAEAILRGPTPG